MVRIAPTAWIAALATIAGLWPAPAFADDIWVGHYTGHIGSYRWTATISKRFAGSYDFHVSVESQMPACIGDFAGPAKPDGGSLLINDEDCTLTVSKLGAEGIRVTEKQCSSSHGVACGFESDLRRDHAGRPPPEAPAMTSGRDFLGTWAPDAGSCAFADSTVRFTVTPNKMEGREFACTLKSASRSGPGWRMRYACIGEGEDYGLDLEWRLGMNGHLLEQAEGESRDYMRCQ